MLSDKQTSLTAIKTSWFDRYHALYLCSLVLTFPIFAFTTWKGNIFSMSDKIIFLSSHSISRLFSPHCTCKFVSSTIHYNDASFICEKPDSLLRLTQKTPVPVIVAATPSYIHKHKIWCKSNNLCCNSRQSRGTTQLKPDKIVLFHLFTFLLKSWLTFEMFLFKT